MTVGDEADEPPTISASPPQPKSRDYITPAQPEAKGSVMPTQSTPEDSSTPDPAQLTANGITYERKIKYTIEYYKKSGHYNSAPEFVSKYSADNSVLASLWDTPSKLAPVLEEKHNVLFPSTRILPARFDETRFRPDYLSDEGYTDGFAKLEPGDQVGLPYIQIHSPLLLNALGAVVKYWSSVSAPKGAGYAHNRQSADDSEGYLQGNFKYPFRDLYYYKKELIDYKEGKYPCCARHPEEYQRQCGEHIDLLTEYLYAQPDIGLAAAEERWTRKIPITNFASLWLLMKPGTDVYVRSKGALNAFVVDFIEGGITFSAKGKMLRAEPYTVKVWGLWFDGNVISRISTKIEIPVFDNEREVKSLPLFPVEFQDNDDNGATRDALVKRGQKFFKCCKGPAYMEYTGIGNAGRTSHVKNSPHTAPMY